MFVNAFPYGIKNEKVVQDYINLYNRNLYYLNDVFFFKQDIYTI